RDGAEGLGHPITGIGVGVPGPVDTAAGRICEEVPHVPELAGRALAAELQERFGLPAYVDNDVNALALAEWRFGAGRGARPPAVAVIEEACQSLGAMIGTIVNGLNPDVVVVTGGVAISLATLETRILKAAGEYAFPRALATTRVTIVPSDKRTSMRGAAALV